MGWKSKAALGVAGVLAILVAVVAIRTITYQAPAAVDVAGANLAPARPVNLDAAARHLSEAVQIPTVSHQDKADNDWAQWDALHAWLEATYPAAHAAMSCQVVAGHALVYTWPGSDPALPPIVLMAHQDVVPITPGTEGDWKHPPFAGEIAEGAVWGRGSIDDKGSLVALFEAADMLAAGGFKPVRTVMIVSGHDEEAGGTGAQAAAAWMKAGKIKAAWTLDEGMAVIADYPMLDTPVAVIGVGEKGYATMRVTAPAKGGHSSAPPRETGVETLAKAVLAITGKPFPLRLDGPGGQMMKAIAPYAKLPVRVVVANEWLFGPLLKAEIAKNPAGAASLHTTIAPTMLKGSPKENVLPQDASAWINYRIAPGQTMDDVMARAKSAVGGLDVQLAWEGHGNNPSPVSATDSAGWKVLSALASEDGALPVAPGLVTAGTDSRYLVEASDDVYRFAPVHASITDFSMIHGTNEHMSLENLERMVRFYARLIETAAAR